MSGFRFRGDTRAPGSGAYRKLQAGCVTSAPSAVGCCKGRGCAACGAGAHETIKQSLVLAGLEEAVVAARETSEAIRRAGDILGEIHSANREASALATHQVAFAEQLAEELAARGLWARYESFSAHKLRLKPEELGRLLE